MLHLKQQWLSKLRTLFSVEETCLCTTAKRDSFYDDLPELSNKTPEQQSSDFFGFMRTDKPRRLIRQANMDESDGEDDTNISDKLRRASSHSPANIPMLVVVSFSPDAKGLQKKQIEIQRGFPVNAQFILNEWLFVKTADNDEGFVPYVCCRPMLRRQSFKQTPVDMEHSYKPYDFDSNKSRPSKSPSTSTATCTPPTNKKFSIASTTGSQSALFQSSSTSKKRPDVTSSSCGGDSGFSDGESSSHHQHHYRSFDLSTQRYTRSSNVRSLRLSSNALKKNELIVQDLPLKKSTKINHSHGNLTKSDGSQRIKSQLSISSNSAFTQFVKKNTHSDHESHQQRQESRSNTRLFYHRQDVSPSSSSISHLRRPYNSYDETRHRSSPGTKCPSTISSPYIRRTPFARRSLPHHLQPVMKKTLKPTSSASPDPFQTIKKEQQLRHVVLAEPAIEPAIVPFKSTLERQFSDLSLNQIENDSLIPSTSVAFVHNRPSLSYSSSSPSSSSTDESSTAFVHIHLNNTRCNVLHRGESIPFVFATKTNQHHDLAGRTNSSGFIQNVSITV